MPPRGVYKARQEEKKKQNRSPRPAQESRSDRREQERQERANAQRALAQAKERARVALVKSQKEALASAKAKSKAQSPARGADNAKKIQTVVSKASGSKTTRKVVEANQPVKMSPPLEKARATSKRGLTITGGKISTYSGGESGPKQKSLIYKDPNTGSTIATKEARTNIAKGGDYNIVASTASKKLGKGIPTPTTKERPGLKGTSPTGMLFSPTTPSISAGQIIGQKPKPKTAGPKGFTKKTPTDFMKQQAQIVDRLDQPSQTKLDLLTGDPVKPTTPTLLSELTKKRKRRQKSGFTGIMAQIRTLLG